MNLSPYDILVVASLVQQEANSQDFSKVAQVIYNRLHDRHTLEFDSTVNYPLDRREVATTDADRAQRTPWNTYVSQGLPATAICSPGVDALHAAEHPEPGDWLYFVTIDAQGTTLFTKDYQQHLANIELAKRNGVLDSARVGAPLAAQPEKPGCSARRSRIRGPRNCTWPPTARWACTTGPTSASSAAPRSCRAWSAGSGPSGSACR